MARLFCILSLFGHSVLASLPMQMRYHEIWETVETELFENGRGDSVGAHRSLKDHLDDYNVETVELPLDHFGSTNRTFQNRFVVDASSYKKGGPVVFLDAGEATAFDFNSGQYLRNFLYENSPLRRVADAHGGMMIVWEHRFYGKSTPVNITNETPATEFEFLTTEQALADVAHFAYVFNRTDFPDVDFTPAGSPWIFIGGSYPGMRAAFMRSIYPNIIQASWASSAPVQARVDMSVYYDMVWRGMQAAGYGNCTKDIKAALNEIDQQLGDPATSKAIKEKFFGPDAGKNSNEGFADALSTVYNTYQHFGSSTKSTGLLGDFCDWLSKDPETNEAAPLDGWAREKGAAFTINRWADWPWLTYPLNAMDTNCAIPGRAARKGNKLKADCNFDKPLERPDSISWMWQYCTEWGYLQVASTGERQLLSKYNTLQHAHDVCHRQFPDGKASGLLPDWPDVDLTNLRYGGWNITTSNVYWTNGEFDPWRTLGVMSDEEFAPKFEITQEVPECGQLSKDDEKVFGYLVPGAQHCSDLRIKGEDSFFNENAQPAIDLWLKAAKKWLDCWAPWTQAGGPNEVISGGPKRLRLRET